MKMQACIYQYFHVIKYDNIDWYIVLQSTTNATKVDLHKLDKGNNT